MAAKSQGLSPALTRTIEGRGRPWISRTDLISLYDLGGHVVTEVSSTGSWNRGEVFAGGHHLATYSGGTTYFIHADWLGTERLRANVAGSSVETCTNQPFGDNQACVGTDVSPLHFTGKQRDTETGNDDFGTRYFNSNTARWLTPDWSARPEGTPYASMDNPQSLNLYAYVGNRPTGVVDPDGHEMVYPHLAALDLDEASDWFDPQAGAQVQQQVQEQKQTSDQAHNPPAQQPTQPSERAKQIAERVIEGAEGLVNLELAKVKGEAAVAAAATAETGVGAAAAAYLGISAAGNAVAGVTQIAGALTGNTKDTTTAAQAVTTVTSGAGFIRTITSGSIEKGSKWASYEAILTTKPSDIFHGKALAVAAKLIDFVLNVKEAAH